MTEARRGLDLLFFTALAFLFCHELDAVAQSEWRLLPFLSRLDDSTAYVWFVALHVPLFAGLLWWTSSTSPRTRRTAQLVLDAFMVIHAGLHFTLQHSPEYTFHSTLSEALIFGAGTLALLHATLTWRSRTGTG